jgi:PAS domain S-box-containing protein
MAPDEGWSSLFASAFQRSRNAMLLTDAQRVIVDANPAVLALLGRDRDDVIGRPVYRFVAGGPLVSTEAWAETIAGGRFSGEAGLVAADGTITMVQWAASVETVTGRRLVLFVAMSTSRWGQRFRRVADEDAADGGLTARQQEIVHMVSLGASGPEIADELQISHETVRTHVRNAMGKLGARSRAHLVAKALGTGVVPVRR